MEYFWAILVSVIILLIIYGMISSNVRQRRLKRATEVMLPSVKQHFEAGRRYNVLSATDSYLSACYSSGFPRHSEPSILHFRSRLPNG